jgi:hypothetical protein
MIGIDQLDIQQINPIEFCEVVPGHMDLGAALMDMSRISIGIEVNEPSI